MARIHCTVCIVTLLALTTAQGQIGIFENQTDVGSVMHPGTAEYDAAAKTYTVSGSGENMWAAQDEFHYVWKKVSARDVALTATISILGEGGDGHRKAVLMIRQSLDGDSAYVDAARHGDGLASLQFRGEKGKITREVESSVSGPATLRLAKQGDSFYLWIAGENEDLHFAGGSARIEMKTPFYVGIGVCAHRKDAVVKAAFTNVSLNTKISHPEATYSTVETVLASGDARSAYVSTKHLSAPGWTADGRSLTFKVDGHRQEAPFVPLKTAAPVGPPAAVLEESPFVYYSSEQNGTMQIWRKPTSGGAPEQLTSDDFHNVSPSLSPDGKRLLILSYAKDHKTLPANGEMTLRVILLADKSIRTLTTFTGGQGSLGALPWSPDGRRITYASYQSMASH